MNNENKILSILEKMDARLDKMDARLDKMDTRLDKLEQGQAEIRADIREAQALIVDVVEVVGQKTDQLEKTIRDMQGATAQNSYELQVLKNKAQ